MCQNNSFENNFVKLYIPTTSQTIKPNGKYKKNVIIARKPIKNRLQLLEYLLIN